MKLLVMAKLENKLKPEKIKIGILGGTFDPAHKGHLEISKQAKKIFELKNIVWAITKKNPFKNESKSSLRSRIQFAKRLIGKNDYIKVKFYEEKIGSNRTVDLIKHLNKKKNNEIYFIMGADNLINFHKWYKWKAIIKECSLSLEKLKIPDLYLSVDSIPRNKTGKLLQPELKEKIQYD